MSAFSDGLTNVFNSLINRRNAQTQNEITVNPLREDQMRAIWRTGIGSKIVRVKSGYALNDTLQFESVADQEAYELRLQKAVKKASGFMLGFGRGIIVIHSKGDDLTTQIRKPVDIDSVKLDVFSGDMVTVSDVSLDLRNPRYMKPLIYNVRGYPVHWSRVIDFTYWKPSEMDLPQYKYGGVSEFELIHEQLINDGIVSRASAAMVEKSSSFVYKIKGFKEAMRAKRDDDMVKYFGRIEDMRSIYGAVLIDAEDDAASVNQNLSNLSDTDQITLRRLSMVTGIPLAILVGENVKGLNSTGDNERQVFQDMIETLQSEYLLEPINQLLCLLGFRPASFKDNQGDTPDSRITYETKAIDNAFKLWQMGEDYEAYLNRHDVTKPDEWQDFWGKGGTEPEQNEPIDLTKVMESLGVENENIE